MATQGTRLRDGDHQVGATAGQYWYNPGDDTWYFVDPGGTLGNLDNTYQVTENDDGTIVVTPDIVTGTYQGNLTNGIWS